MSFVARNHPQQVKVRGALDAVDDLATTPEAFAVFHERFGFSIDVAASAENTKLPRYYDRDADGLSRSWAGERVWCNPPYSNIRPWIEKAHTSMFCEHAWLGASTSFAGPFRFCRLCDREEWENGVVRPGWYGLAKLVVMLLPANRTEQGWWQDLIEPYRLDGRIRVEFLRGRMRFIKPGADAIGPNERPPFGVCLVIWGAQS